MSVYAFLPGHCPNGVDFPLTNPGFFYQGSKNNKIFRLFSTCFNHWRTSGSRLVDVFFCFTCL